jgi:septal ring factor EnvC (AmiA/AmiB activator)
MSRANKAVIVAVVATFGLWGCARGPSTVGAAGAERIKALEVKIAKMEEDFRAAAAARDNFRQRLAGVEQQRAALEQEVAALRVTVRERDDLRKQLVVRTGERDTLQVQYDQFRKGLRDLLGQAEAAASGATTQPVTVVTPPATQDKAQTATMSLN